MTQKTIIRLLCPQLALAITVPFLFCAAMVLIFLAGAESQAIAQAIITLNAPLIVRSGDQFNFEILTTEVVNLDTASLKISFDGSVFEYQKVVLTGTLMAGASLTVNSPTAGRLIIVMNLPGLDGVSGSGILAKISFKAIGSEGLSGNITLTEIMLGDTSAIGIPTEIPEPTVTISIEGIVPVGLSSFTAKVTAGGILLQWRTETEVANLGFNVYRSTHRDGKYTKVNPRLIKGQGTTASPHEYRFFDEMNNSKQSYYYYIEDINFSGDSNRSEIIRVQAPQFPTIWGKIKSCI